MKIKYLLSTLITLTFLFLAFPVSAVSPTRQEFGGTSTSTIFSNQSVIYQGNGSYAGIPLGSNGQVLGSSGGSLQWVNQSGGTSTPSLPTVITVTTPVTVTTSTTETNLINVTIPPNTLGTNRALEAQLFLDPIQNVSSTDASITSTFRVYYGGTLISTLAPNFGGHTPRVYTGNLTVKILANGATNAQIGSSQLATYQDPSIGNAVAGLYTSQTSTSAIDSTQPQTLRVTIQQSENIGGNQQVTMQNAIVNLLSASGAGDVFASTTNIFSGQNIFTVPPLFVNCAYWATSTVSNLFGTICLNGSDNLKNNLLQNSLFSMWVNSSTPADFSSSSFYGGDPGDASGNGKLSQKTSGCLQGTNCAQVDLTDPTSTGAIMSGSPWVLAFSQPFTYNPANTYDFSVNVKELAYQEGGDGGGPQNIVGVAFSNLPFNPTSLSDPSFYVWDVDGTGWVNNTNGTFSCDFLAPALGLNPANWITYTGENGFNATTNTVGCALPTGDVGTTTIYANFIALGFPTTTPIVTDTFYADDFQVGVANTATPGFSITSPTTSLPINIFGAPLVIHSAPTGTGQLSFSMTPGNNYAQVDVSGNGGLNKLELDPTTGLKVDSTTDLLGQVTFEYNHGTTNTILTQIDNQGNASWESLADAINPVHYIEADGQQTNFSWADPNFRRPDAFFGYDSSTNESVIYGGDAGGGFPGELSYRVNNPSLTNDQQEMHADSIAGTDTWQTRFGFSVPGTPSIQSWDIFNADDTHLFDLNSNSTSLYYSPFEVSSTLSVISTSTLATSTFSGFVGIGTTTPSYQVDVYSPNAVSPSLERFSSDGSTGGGGFLTSAGDFNFFTSSGCYWNGTNWISASTFGCSVIGGGAGGAITPGGSLTFYAAPGASISSTIPIQNYQQEELDPNGDDYFGFPVGNVVATSTRLFIQGSTGNIGIRTNAPTENLTVIGNASIGDSNTATGTDAVAFGHNNSAGGNYSVAGGIGDSASNVGSIALGSLNNSTGNTSVCLGKSNTCSGDNSIALGDTNTVTSSHGIAIGQKGIVKGDNSVLINLANNFATLTQTNTLAVTNGNVGVGTTTPQKSLVVVGEAFSTGTTTASCLTNDGVNCAGMLLTTTTASLGGSPLTIGTVATNTSTLVGALVGMGCKATYSSYPGDGVMDDCYISATDTVVTVLNVNKNTTPVATSYVIDVFKK